MNVTQVRVTRQAAYDVFRLAFTQALSSSLADRVAATAHAITPGRRTLAELAAMGAAHTLLRTPNCGRWTTDKVTLVASSIGERATYLASL